MRAVVVLLVLLVARGARGDDVGDRKQQAEQLAADALRRISDRNDYAGASDNFQKAYDLTGELPYLLNVAVTRRKANLPHQAVAAYRRYLADGGSAVPEALRQQVAADIEAILRDSVQVTVRTAGAEAEVLLDDIPVGVASSAAPLLVLVNSDAGRRHTLRATRAGHLASEQALGQLQPGQRLEVMVEPRANTARLTIDSVPPAALLTEGEHGRVLGSAPQSVDLPPGDYELYARLPRHEPGRERVHVVAGEPQHVTIRLAKVEPTWWDRHHTKVYVGGGSLLVAVAGVFIVREMLKPDYQGTVIVYPGD